ncbi:hypothetical protein Poli38472_001612 [Pythium oligandrum]|uniref:Protein kinase domain-containing protein n=1 Tax=Pythium oligandrum TaxID=41045 RepID=A0A8K1CTA2_PYTOL|nr:hypothetical protein Poli38472_001612 [Pythium oligandrum]|eukprot:TMW69456.1 hypothetical protein Poli38472_001612 [Pythium oligandrum]
MVVVRSALVLAAVAFVSNVEAARSAAATSCEHPVNTLTLDCGQQCILNALSCVIYSMNSTANVNACDGASVSGLSECMPPDYSCRYQCFQAYATAEDTYKFYVPYGEWESEQEKALSADAEFQKAVKLLPDDSENTPWQSNDYVQSIGALKLPSSLTTVVIAGGKSETGVRGKVVDLTISSDVFKDAAQVQRVGWYNMNVGTRLPKFATVLPTGLKHLELSNCLLTSIPTEMTRLTTLTRASLPSNYLSSLPATVGMASLTFLNVSQNNLSSMEAVYSSLETLDLSNNAFTSIPAAVYGFSKLKTLIVSGNPLAKAVVTQAQYDYLSKLSSLQLGSFAEKVNCGDGSEEKLGGVTVCVTTEDGLAKAVAGSSGSSSTGIIAGVVAGVVVLLIGGFVWYRRKSKKRGKGAKGTDDVGMAFRMLEHSPEINEPAQEPNANPERLDEAKNLRKGSTGTTTMSSSTLTASHESSLTNHNSGTNGSNHASQGSNHASGSGSTASVSSSQRTIMLPKRSERQISGQTLWEDDDLLAVQVRPEEIEDIRLIGSGGYGVVWLVRYRQTRLLASKRLVKDQISRQKIHDFVDEIKLMSTLAHPSIVEFVGVAWTMETDIQALLDYMPNGDLRTYLEATAPENNMRSQRASEALLTGESGRPSSPWHPSWESSKWQLALDVIEALVYVHSFNPPLVHRDLKSRNVLLSGEMKAKLSDFGVSRFESEFGTMTTGVGTGKWLAPEVIAGSKTYDSSCDVYAFGVVLSELDTHKVPYDNVRGPQGNRLPEIALLQMVAAGQLQPNFSDACPEDIVKLARDCLAFDRHARPTAVEVAFRLRNFASQFGGFA